MKHLIANSFLKIYQIELATNKKIVGVRNALEGSVTSQNDKI